MSLQNLQGEHLSGPVLCQSSSATMSGSIGCLSSYHCRLEPGAYCNNECIIIRVVKSLSIFFRESNGGVVYSCHLRYGPCKLDILDHPEVGLASLSGRPSGRYAPYNHSFICQGWPGSLVIPSCSRLLWWVCPFLVNKPL